MITNEEYKRQIDEYKKIVDLRDGLVRYLQEEIINRDTRISMLEKENLKLFKKITNPRIVPREDFREFDD